MVRLLSNKIWKIFPKALPLHLLILYQNQFNGGQAKEIFNHFHYKLRKVKFKETVKPKLRLFSTVKHLEHLKNNLVSSLTIVILNHRNLI